MPRHRPTPNLLTILLTATLWGVVPGVLATTAIDPVLLEKLANTMASRYQDTDRFDAEVWLRASEQRLAKYIDDHDERLTLLETVYREANRNRLDADLVLAVMQVESAFDRYAISRVGAQGLMQVMPFWKNEIGRPEDNLTDRDTNLRYGCRILQFYLQREKGHLAKALARYNGSVGKTWYSELVMDAWYGYWIAGDL